MRGVVTLGTLVALALTVGAVEETRREGEGAAVAGLRRQANGRQVSPLHPGNVCRLINVGHARIDAQIDRRIEPRPGRRFGSQSPD